MSCWQDMSTAPKDGTHIDLWAQERERYAPERIPDCFWWKGAWRRLATIYDDPDKDDFAEVYNPTCWMPRPAPPISAAR